jgi:choice-of-anchor B domain-containing protein
MKSVFIFVLISFSPLFLNSQALEHGVRLLARWDSPLPPENGREAKYNEVWGFEYDGEEYGVIGSTLGTHVIHIKSNNAVVEVAFIEGDASADYVIHRDFDTHDGFLYAVCDQEPSSLQVIDIRSLPETATLVNSIDEYFTTAHNVTVDSYRNKLYISGPAGHALCIMDLADDPANPQFLNYFDQVTYVHDCYVRRDTAFLHCAGQGMFVFNFEDSTAPQALGSLEEYTDQGYNHSGWWSSNGEYYVFADETPGKRLKVCDVRDLSDIQVYALFNSGTDPETMAHNVMLKGDTAYVSHYYDGLQVFDLTDLDDPKRIAWYDTFRKPNNSGRGAWGIYAGLPSGRILISDRQRGLHVFYLDKDFSLAGSTTPTINPNPGNGMLTISLTSYPTLNKVEHRVFDSLGRLIDSGNWIAPGYGPWFGVDLTKESSGIYFVEVVVDGIPHILKYLKN